jgi:hypothetical protein
MIWPLTLLLILLTAAIFFSAGWLFRGDRDRRRAYRQADAIMRLAREEEAEESGRAIDYYDSGSGVIRRVRWTGPRWNSWGGSA